MRSHTAPNGATLTSNGSADGDQCVATFARVCQEMEAEKRAAHDALRARGVVAVGADDGWVDRKANKWTPPSYASIYGPIEVGSLIALGWPWESFRIVRVTKVDPSPYGMTGYHFEPIADQ